MKRLAVYIIGCIVIVLTLRSLFNTTFFPIHDFTHVVRLVELDTALQDGHFPVRWVRNLGYGYGMPLYNFYGPMPFYLAELFHLVGFSALASVKAMMIVMAGVAFGGMYLLSSSYFGVAGGLLSATAFLVFPYRALDLFVRGAFNELFALSLIPLVLYCILRVREQKTWASVGVFSLSLMTFFTSHNLMTLMFFPVVYGFSVLQLFAKGIKKMQYLLHIHVGIVLGIAASSFYLLPSFFEKGWTQVDKLIGGYGMYVYHFLYIRQLFQERWGYGGSFGGPEDGMSFHIGWIHLLLAVAGALFWYTRSSSPYKRVLAIFFSGVTGSALFMTLYKSQFIWDRIPLFVYFQFPWRFLSITAVSIPFLVGASGIAVAKTSWRIPIVALLMMILVGSNLRFFAPEKLLDDPKAMYYEDPKKIQESMSDILPDYIPVWMKTWQKPFQQQFEITKGDAKTEILIDRTQEKLVRIQAASPVTLLMRIAWFPQWTVYDNGIRIEHHIEDDTGFFSVPLGVGEHLVSIVFEDTPLRVWTNIISVCALLIILGVIGYDHHRRRSA